ncbi:uncharacterized protein LOC117791559 [Drosophila innubila]|uniref:uncharacterized protein LOC117791559 n=1 Tax=Drosophila innubila TaxID=198719 RepID=UPI00148DEB42|nr:uncharacterized protein LOC117791559 [Drosophila innubila]
MSMSSETTGANESNSPNIAESSISNNTVEIKKLDTQATTSKVISVLNSERNFKEETNDIHLDRLQNLRNELNYINDTDWMYESLDKKPQQ